MSSAANLPQLHEIPLDGENFSHLIGTVKLDIESKIASGSVQTAAPDYPPRPEAMSELNDKLYRYNRAQRKTEVAEEENKRFKEPADSLASFVFNLRVEVDPDTMHKGDRTFNVIGDLCVRRFGEDIVISHCNSVKIPKGSKIEFAGVDGLVDAVADYFPNLIETQETKRLHEIAREVMSVANVLYPASPDDEIDSDESDETLSQLEEGFEMRRNIDRLVEEAE